MNDVLTKLWLALKSLFNDVLTGIIETIIKPILLIKYFIKSIFAILFIMAGYSLFKLSYAGLHMIINDINSARADEINEKKIIKGIELIFISPIPLLIISSFKNYYDNIISLTISKKESADPYLEKSRFAALKDLTLVKYLFVSILISTIFTIIIEVLFSLNEESEINQSYSETLSRNFPALSISFLVLIFLIVYIKVLGKHLPNEPTSNHID